jgi:hypothetical protein
MAVADCSEDGNEHSHLYQLRHVTAFSKRLRASRVMLPATLNCSRTLSRQVKYSDHIQHVSNVCIKSDTSQSEFVDNCTSIIWSVYSRTNTPTALGSAMLRCFWARHASYLAHSIVIKCVSDPLCFTPFYFRIFRAPTCLIFSLDRPVSCVDCIYFNWACFIFNRIFKILWKLWRSVPLATSWITADYVTIQAINGCE